MYKNELHIDSEEIDKQFCFFGMFSCHSKITKFASFKG